MFDTDGLIWLLIQIGITNTQHADSRVTFRGNSVAFMLTKLAIRLAR